MFEWNPRALFAKVFPDTTLCQRAISGLLEHPDWVALDRGTLDIAHAAERVAARTVLDENELQSPLKQVADFLVPIPETVELARRIAQLGHRIFCLSNMHIDTIDTLEKRESFWDIFEGG